MVKLRRFLTKFPGQRPAANHYFDTDSLHCDRHAVYSPFPRPRLRAALLRADALRVGDSLLQPGKAGLPARSIDHVG